MKKPMLMIMVLLINAFIGFGIVIPVLPELVSQLHFYVMLSVYSAVSFIMSPFWGAWSDRRGRRPILLTGILGFGLSFLILAASLIEGLSNNQELWLMYISRILGGFFSGAVASCAVAYVADITTNEQRTKGMGMVGMSIGLGFIFGPAIGGLLIPFGYAVPFIAAAVLAVITYFVILKHLGESLPPERRTAGTGSRASRWKAFQGPLKYLYVLGFFITFSLAGLEGTLQYFQVQKIGATATEMGIMFAIMGIVGALVQGGVVRRYIKKGTETRFMIMGLLFCAAGFFLILFSTSFLTATIYLSVYAVGNALLRPCITSLITQKTTVGQGIATGLSSSMDSLGRIGGPLFALGLNVFDISLPFISGAILSLLAIGLVWGFVTADRERQMSTAV